MSKTLTREERALLERFVQALEANHERDPKYAVVLELPVAIGLAGTRLHRFQPVLRFG